jgi:hypothetical protein
MGQRGIGNTTLVDYGIQNEQSDIRAHVSVLTKRVYVFDTSIGRELAESGQYPEGKAYTGRIITGVGALVPPRDIEGLRAIPIPDDIWAKREISKFDNTGTKGDKAVLIVSDMLKCGLIPVELRIDQITDETLQIEGLDIVVAAKVRIQVKCDYKAGPRKWGGTGNLFLQVAECNPLGAY